mgnify:FL=1
MGCSGGGLSGRWAGALQFLVGVRDEIAQLGDAQKYSQKYVLSTRVNSMDFLYVIGSGNDDDIHKIGISNSPNRRLEQIKRNYDVPNAFIIETMDVSTRGEVFAIENALHAKFDLYQSNKYEGREWFKLNKKQLNQLVEMYREESNAFAQATAYYGIIDERLKLHDKAQEMEAARQMQITHNRRHGKKYDTRPQGYLKRYNDLGVKMSSGVLAERFSFESYEHPILEIVRDITSEIRSEVVSLTKGYWWKVGAGGMIAGMLVAGVSNSPNISPVAWLTAGVGAIGGGMTTAVRTQKEADQAKSELMAEAK